LSQIKGSAAHFSYEISMTPQVHQPLIAVVEDDGDVLSALRFALEADGYAVCAFPDPAQALVSRCIDSAECLVIDYGLPGMDGVELMQALRRRNVDCPAIIITGNPTERCRREARAAGASVLEKPLMAHALARQIQAALTAAV
jgi:two-component system, LuxR family, response regulator FixJ